jgi:hypothetical protein
VLPNQENPFPNKKKSRRHRIDRWSFVVQ